MVGHPGERARCNGKKNVREQIEVFLEGKQCISCCKIAKRFNSSQDNHDLAGRCTKMNASVCEHLNHAKNDKRLALVFALAVGHTSDHPLLVKLSLFML